MGVKGPSGAGGLPEQGLAANPRAMLMMTKTMTMKTTATGGGLLGMR